MQGFFVVTNFNPTFPFCKLLMAPGGAKMNYDGFKNKCVGLIPLL